MFKAAIRVNKIATIAQLRGATLHAERQDETSKARIREGAEAGDGLAWSKADTDRDYLAAFKAHKAETGAKERKGAPLCMQALCVVSPEWVEKAGDLHDATNPHNQQLFDQAKAWAESWAGKGAVFGARLDLDEKGGAVVDLMISPVRESRGKPVISTQKALTELKGITGERNEYAALQTSWADWARDHLDSEIVRGTRKEITARQHMSPETYGAVMDKARESLSEAPERLREAILLADLHHHDMEDLSDLMALKTEISRHKALRTNYEPPEGPLKLMHVHDRLDWRDGWPLINAIRERAERIVNTATRLGMGLIDSANDRYENGKDIFPSLDDRMHLSAVVAHCGAFCAKVEATVKNLLRWEGTPEISEKNCWPHNSLQEVERHQVNLGLTVPDIISQHDQLHSERDDDRDEPDRDTGGGHKM
jgi:hypothetical protein